MKIYLTSMWLSVFVYYFHLKIQQNELLIKQNKNKRNQTKYGWFHKSNAVASA